jgi:3-methyladenine DNA glycosylase AlkD
MCGVVIGPLLVAHPERMPDMRAWANHRIMWVRRASIVGLLPLVRSGSAEAVALVYEIALRLHMDPNDLIHKAVGWALREAGKSDPLRLEQYLRSNVGQIPRTTFRYAIERFEPRKRSALLVVRP